MTDFFSSPLVLRSLLALFLISISCGIIGSYVIVKRCSYMVGSISHSLLGGIGLALFCQQVLHWQWFSPLAGTLLASIFVASLLTLLTRRNQLSNDVILSAVWALGMAIGVSFIYAIPGYPVDLTSYLFGDIWLVSTTDLWVMLLMDIIILIIVLLFHNRLLYLCFNEEGLRLRGVKADWYLLILHLLIALTIVQLAQVVGIVLCLATLILPAAAATTFLKRMPAIMFFSALICFFCSSIGLYGGYMWNLPTGAFIIEIIGGFYLLTIPVCYIIKRYSIYKNKTNNKRIRNA